MHDIPKLFVLLARVSVLVDWLIVASLQLLLLWVALAALWWTQVPPQALLDALLRFAQSKPGIVLGLLGLSVPTGLALWLKACAVLARKLTSRYVWRGIDG